VKPFSDDTLYSRLLALSTNAILGWKGLPGTNSNINYNQNSDEKFFMTLSPGAVSGMQIVFSSLKNSVSSFNSKMRNSWQSKRKKAFDSNMI